MSASVTVHTDSAEMYNLWRYDDGMFGGPTFVNKLFVVLETEYVSASKYNLSACKQAEADEKAIARAAEPLLRSCYGGPYLWSCVIWVSG